MKLFGMLLAAVVVAGCQSTVPEDTDRNAAEAAKPAALLENAAGGAVAPVALTDMGSLNPDRADIRRFSENMVATGQFSQEEMRRFFSSLRYRGEIIGLMDKPSTSQPWYVFRRNNVGGSRVPAGNRFWADNAAVIENAARRYGVPPELLVAIIGIETNYGSYMGSYRVADALATLAFNYPRRADFFQQELAQFLLLSKEEQESPLVFKGSYAGAMGMPQFMPSSYRKWAVDFDGDGHRDIWNNVGDAAASAANYMKQHGWKTGQPMSVTATLVPTPQLEALMNENTRMDHTAGQLRRMGVVIPASVADNEKAVLFRLETAPGVFEYRVGLNNFYTVWHYNNSRLYVSAVEEIANSLSRSSGNL